MPVHAQREREIPYQLNDLGFISFKCFNIIFFRIVLCLVHDQTKIRNNQTLPVVLTIWLGFCKIKMPTFASCCNLSLAFDMTGKKSFTFPKTTQ